MTNYEQRLISDLRRSQGKALGKLDKRIDRASDARQRMRADLKDLRDEVAGIQIVMDRVVEILSTFRGARLSPSEENPGKE